MFSFFNKASLVLALMVSLPVSAASVKQAFSEGKFNGKIRVYNSTLAFQHATDKYGTAFGGSMGFETKAEHLYGFSLGAVYYTANDLETNKDDVNARAPFTPTVDVDILGEAYVRWSGYDTVVTAGRQQVITPFANPSDAFVVPISYTGYSLINKSFKGITLQAHQLLSVKVREAQDFTNVGAYALARSGGAPKNTKGTTIVGATYAVEKLKLQAWYYNFADLFNLLWLDTDYAVNSGDYTPYIGFHAGQQKESGDKLLGKIDSTLIGAKLGVRALGADFSLGIESISKDRFLTPYTFFTDPLYTNSMITGFGNIESGKAWKATLIYDFSSQFQAKISHSRFDYNSGADIAESDFDVKYAFAGDLEGLSAQLRIGYRDGDKTPAGLPDLLEYRTQLQYLF